MCRSASTTPPHVRHRCRNPRTTSFSGLRPLPLTRNADRSQSGKAYINYLENGGLLEDQPKEFTQQVFDPQKGTSRSYSVCT
ncbi:hypothetical protein FVV84_19330 [Escherichia coli]|nr:hypothetical protein [Escherichia coli]